jgi:hypothetical protein
MLNRDGSVEHRGWSEGRSTKKGELKERRKDEGRTVSERPMKTMSGSRSYEWATRLTMATVKGRMICGWQI